MEVNNIWVFESTLGQGSFGRVELWKNKYNNERIALKKCKSSESQLTSKQKERWVQEIDIMNKLNHPNIIATKPVPDEVKQSPTSLPVLCMEYCRKSDLRKVLTASENWCGLAEPDAVQIMKDISGAVEYLHGQQITHRDLKPENVVLQQMNDKISYKLIDLGYAKELGQNSMYASIVGTLNYIAPELLWNHKYTCSVDYWSLGILFYEIITGSRPFLPDETSPVIWKQHIEKKSYQDISAQRINNNVVYLQDIQDPTDISPCIKDLLIDWFRTVLQWDSKTRGKHRRDNGTYDIVVFKMLKRILTRKIVHVFSATQYQVYRYEVDDSTRVSVLKSLIESDTKIITSSQELIDSNGSVLKDDGVLQDTFLTLFRTQDTHLISLPEPNLPLLVTRMIEIPKMELSRYELGRCYAAAMFFIKKEESLFRYYILALSMKIDLITSVLDSVLLNKSKLTSAIDLLRTDFGKIKELLQSDTNSGCDYWKQEIKTAMTKLEYLSSIVNDLKIKCDQFLRISETLKGFGNIDWMVEYQEFLDKAQDIMDSFRSRGAGYKHKPIAMAKLIGGFLKFRQSRMKEPELFKIGSQIKLMNTSQATEEISKLEKFIESAIVLTNIYRDETSNLQKKWQNQRRAESSEINATNMEIESANDIPHSEASSSYGMNETICDNSDDVILDNLVIRYMMHDVMTDTYDKFLQTVNLEP